MRRRINFISEDKMRESIGSRYSEYNNNSDTTETIIFKIMLDDMKEMSKDYEKIIDELEMKIVKMENTKFFHDRKIKELKNSAMLGVKK